MRAQIYQLLHAVLASAVTDELIDANPARIKGADLPKRKHTITVATLASWCALRYSEIAELRRGDVDLAENVIRLRRGAVVVKGGWHIGDPKTEAGSRDVAIPPHLIPAIEAHLDDHVGPKHDALLFWATRNGGNLRQSTAYWHFNKARKAAERADLRFHDLRHSGLTMAAQEGATTAELMARGGHSTAEMAMREQHAVQSRDQEIAARLSKAPFRLNTNKIETESVLADYPIQTDVSRLTGHATTHLPGPNEAEPATAACSRKA